MPRITLAQLIAAWVEPATTHWFREQCRDPMVAFYLYYKPATETTDGAVVIATDPLTDAWQLADPRRVSPAWSKRQAATWAAEVCRRLPLLGGFRTRQEVSA
jgi:hypothetical protein